MPQTPGPLVTLRGGFSPLRATPPATLRGRLSCALPSALPPLAPLRHRRNCRREAARRGLQPQVLVFRLAHRDVSRIAPRPTLTALDQFRRACARWLLSRSSGDARKARAGECLYQTRNGASGYGAAARTDPADYVRSCPHRLARSWRPLSFDRVDVGAKDVPRNSCRGFDAQHEFGRQWLVALYPLPNCSAGYSTKAREFGLRTHDFDGLSQRSGGYRINAHRCWNGNLSCSSQHLKVSRAVTTLVVID